MEIELMGVPFDGYGRNGHQARAAQVLREEGLAEALTPHPLHDAGDLALPDFVTSRGPRTGLVNEPALMAMTDQLNEHVSSALAAGKFPVVTGGDCSLLLGVVPALRDQLERAGLLFLDGHEDTMPLDVVEDGEAANCEIGLLLGLTGRLPGNPFSGHGPALDVNDLAMLGQRDADWRRQFNVGSLADIGVWSRSLDQMRHDPAAAACAAAAHLGNSSARWWLHVDLDVLDPEVFAAQGFPDYPDEPGGLDWDQLTAALTSAASFDECVGLSVTIYDPEQDPDRSYARQIVRLIGETLRTRV